MKDGIEASLVGVQAIGVRAGLSVHSKVQLSERAV
jgi:hypothetical protein